MKRVPILLIPLLMVFISVPALSATVTCEVEEVSGGKIVLKNCDERAKGFEKGNKVKVRLQQKVKK